MKFGCLISLVVPNIVAVCVTATNSASSRCRSLTAPTISGVEVVSIESKYVKDHKLSFEPGSVDDVLGDKNLPGLDFCNVTLFLSHPGSDDNVMVSVWLPADEKWNGRFQASGGGGFTTGGIESLIIKGVGDGYASASTDGGHQSDGFDGSWALHENRSLDLPLFRNFASRSLYDMGVVGKAVTERFYRKPAHHSYWSGCSTGGRQGYMMAQKYPELFDGILANAPAIHFTKFVVAEIWPQVVMQQSQTFLSACVVEAFVKASLDACDELDGVKDGVIMDPLACDFDPSTVIGKEVTCNGEKEVITNAMAEVAQKIMEGPKSPNGDRLWYGLIPSTSFKVLASTSIVDGKRTGAPFPISESWIKHLVLRDPDFDWTKMSYEDFAWVFSQSTARLGWLIDTDRPDLSAFRDAGGKLLTYHGLTDDYIPVGGTIQYRQRVEDEMGGLEAVDEFYRLFLVPGVGHCGLPPSPGPTPSDPLASLVAWVEEGKAPDVLHSSVTDPGGDLVERDICRFPYAQEYTGGDAKTASGWECSGEVMAGLRTADANLDSISWNVNLPEKLSPLKWSESVLGNEKKEEL